jgi:hypothetical protein
LEIRQYIGVQGSANLIVEVTTSRNFVNVASAKKNISRVSQRSLNHHANSLTGGSFNFLVVKYKYIITIASAIGA